MIPISHNTRPINSVRLKCNYFLILEFCKTNYFSCISLVTVWQWTHFSILQSISWLVQKVIDLEQTVFYKNEVERPTNQTEIFACGIWMSQWMHGKHESRIKWDIYFWESQVFYQKLLFGGTNLIWKLIIRRLYLLIAYYIFYLLNICKYLMTTEVSALFGIVLSPRSFFSRSREPNNKQNIKDHLSMAKVEITLLAEFLVYDLVELSWCPVTNSFAAKVKTYSQVLGQDFS